MADHEYRKRTYSYPTFGPGMVIPVEPDAYRPGQIIPVEPETDIAEMAAAARQMSAMLMRSLERDMAGIAGIDSLEINGIPVSVAAVAEPPAVKPSREILRRVPARAVQADTNNMQARLAMDAEKLLGYGVLRHRMGLESPLLDVLAKLEIEPFVQDTVERYKFEMLVYAAAEVRRQDEERHVEPWARRGARWERGPIQKYQAPIPEFALEKALQIKRECPEARFEIDALHVVPDPFLVVSLGDGRDGRYYIDVWDEPKFERLLDNS